MKGVAVTVCVCTQCIMHGAMNIAESVEGLKKVKYQLRHKASIELVTKIMADEAHSHHQSAPVASVCGEVIENATDEVIMEKIVSCLRK